MLQGIQDAFEDPVFNRRFPWKFDLVKEQLAFLTDAISSSLVRGYVQLIHGYRHGLQDPLSPEVIEKLGASGGSWSIKPRHFDGKASVPPATWVPDESLRPVVYLRRIAALSEQHEADLILLNLPMFGDPSLSEPYRDLLRSLGRLIEFESLETLYDNRNWNEVMHLDRRGRDIFTRHFLEVYQDQDRGSLPRSPR